MKRAFFSRCATCQVKVFSILIVGDCGLAGQLSQFCKIVALTPLKLTSDISRKLDRFPPKGYPLKVIALALSEKEDCGWNTSSED
jgi:hypothetical protein